MRKLKNAMLCLLIISVTGIVLICGVYKYKITAVSNSKEKIEVTIPSGTTSKGIAKILKDKDLIKDERFFNIYVKLYKIEGMKAGFYELSQNMDVDEIIDILQKGSKVNPNEISITFKEGLTMRKVAETIDKATNNSYDDVINKSNDTEYLNKLISKYWFITKDILNNDIYYKLEGYLYPETYRFNNKDVTVEEIFDKMIDHTSKILNKYKDEVTGNSKFNIHQLLTLASVIESETSGKAGRKTVASVFINRLDKGMSLGSDVTTYYAFKTELSKTDLYAWQYKADNPYNTRATSMAGKLPIGPICNPSVESIEAAIEPTKSDYLYFIADVNGKRGTVGKTYFTVTYDDFLKLKKELLG